MVHALLLLGNFIKSRNNCLSIAELPLTKQQILSLLNPPATVADSLFPCLEASPWGIACFPNEWFAGETQKTDSKQMSSTAAAHTISGTRMGRVEGLLRCAFSRSFLPDKLTSTDRQWLLLSSSQ